MVDPAPDRSGMGALADQLKKLDQRVRQLESPSGTQRVQAVAELQAAIEQLNYPAVGSAEDDGFSLSGPLVVQFNMTVPDDMDLVDIFIVGHVEALDMTSGGLAVAQAYLEVSGTALTWSRGPFSASKDAGASVVNNVISPVTGFRHAVTPASSLLIAMTVTATNPSAFTAQASNFAILQAFAIFSKA